MPSDHKRRARIVWLAGSQGSVLPRYMGGSLLETDASDNEAQLTMIVV